MELKTFTEVRCTSNITVGEKVDDSIMRGFYFVAFIEYMLTGKTLLDYTILFSPNYHKNDKIIYKYFKDKYAKFQI